MSLQPGAVFLPTGDPRSGAISGARSDQSNVTLDGVDVNDPELGTAYTTVLRMPLDAIAGVPRDDVELRGGAWGGRAAARSRS